MGREAATSPARSFLDDPAFGARAQAFFSSEDRRVSWSHVRHGRNVANHNVLEALGRRIAELRRQAGMTQEQLAVALDIGARNVQRLEQGRLNSTVLYLARLASVLGVELPALFEPSSHVRRAGRPRKHKAEPAKKPAAPPKAKPAAKQRPAKPAAPPKAKSAAKTRPAAPAKVKPAAKAKARPAAPAKPAQPAKAKAAAKKPVAKQRPAKAKRPRKR